MFDNFYGRNLYPPLEIQQRNSLTMQRLYSYDNVTRIFDKMSVSDVMDP